MEKIFYHRVNKTKNHPTTRKGQTLYRVRSYDYSINDDSWEVIENLPRRKVLNYHRLKILQPFDDIDKAVIGLYVSSSQNTSKRDS